jgi:hypothetical protein
MIKKTSKFSVDFSKIHFYKTSRRSLALEQRFFMQIEKRTDMTKLTVAFRKFANDPHTVRRKIVRVRFIANDSAVKSVFCEYKLTF